MKQSKIGSAERDFEAEYEELDGYAGSKLVEREDGERVLIVYVLSEDTAFYQTVSQLEAFDGYKIVFQSAFAI